MGKDKKKSAVKDAAPVAPFLLGNNGKRKAEDVPMEQSDAKKQKRNDGVGQPKELPPEEALAAKKSKTPPPANKDLARKKSKTPPPVKQNDSRGERGEGSDNDEETESTEKEALPRKKSKTPPPAKKETPKKGKLPAKNVSTGSTAAPKKVEGSSSDNDGRSSTEETDGSEPATEKTKVKENANKKDSHVGIEENESMEKELPVQEEDISGESEDGFDNADGDSNNQLALIPPQTLATPHGQTSGPKTLFVHNLPFDVEKENVIKFFNVAGKVVEAHLSYDRNGRNASWCKGSGHVEFATAKGAQKAYDTLNGATFDGRVIRLDLSHERAAYTPSAGDNSFQMGGRGQSQTIQVRGFNPDLTEYQARHDLTGFFCSCGEITNLSIPTDRESRCIKGIAYLNFKDGNGFSEALELDGSELNGYHLSVSEAIETSCIRDSSGGGRGRGNRCSGGRFGDCGGRLVMRRMRQRKPSIPASEGKKTKFVDEDD